MWTYVESNYKKFCKLAVSFKKSQSVLTVIHFFCHTM